MPPPTRRAAADCSAAGYLSAPEVKVEPKKTDGLNISSIQYTVLFDACDSEQDWSGRHVGDFAAEVRRRLDRASEAVRAAGEADDEYGVATHLAELEGLVRIADQHGLTVGPSILSAIGDAADQPREGRAGR